MSEQPKPDPYPLNPIFNPNDFNQSQTTTIDVAYLNANYLKYPSAQGTETFGSINVNALATFNSTSQFNGISNFANQVNVGTDGIDCSGNLNLIDLTASGTTTELLLMAQKNNGNRVGFILNAGGGAYNPITQLNDSLLAFGDVGAVSTSFVIAPWHSTYTANGVRMTETALMLGSGGVGNQSPIHRLNTDTTQFRITSSNFVVDGNMTLIASNPINRQITSSYFNVNDITANLTGTQMYQSTGTFYLDNNYATSGSFTFALNNSAGTQQIPLQITSTNIQTNKNIVMGSGTNITFPDSTQQITAYTTSQLKVRTFTITTNQTNYLIPSGVYKVDFKVIGRGGNYGSPSGSYTGGSGAGAQMVMLNGCPMIDGYYINISFVATSGGVIGYTQIQDAYDSTIIARAYNGGDGGNATPTTAGIGGVVSPFASPTNPTINSNYGNAYALQGSNGSAGGLNVFPSSIGLVKGSPPNTTFNYGNGNLNSVSTWGTGAVILTCYYT